MSFRSRMIEWEVCKRNVGEQGIRIDDHFVGQDNCFINEAEISN